MTEESWVERADDEELMPRTCPPEQREQAPQSDGMLRVFALSCGQNLRVLGRKSRFLRLISFICSIIQHILRTYYVLDTVLGVRVTMVIQTAMVLVLLGVTG